MCHLFVCLFIVLCRKVSHPNVLKLLAVTLTSEPTSLVMVSLSGQSFKTYELVKDTTRPLYRENCKHISCTTNYFLPPPPSPSSLPLPPPPFLGVCRSVSLGAPPPRGMGGEGGSGVCQASGVGHALPPLPQLPPLRSGCKKYIFCFLVLMPTTIHAFN